LHNLVPVGDPVKKSEAAVGQDKRTLTDGALDVTDNVADAVGVGGVVVQLDLDLGDTSAGAGTAENLENLGVLDNGLILEVHKTKDRQ